MVHICPVGAREGQRPCIHCKGPHREEDCPLYRRALAMYKVKGALKQSFSGSAPAPFIGRFGYPNVNVGILAPPHQDDVWEYDAPRHWANAPFTIPDIVGFRSELVNSRSKAEVRGSSRMQELAQLVAIASRPVDVELNLKKVPVFRLSFDTAAAPSGPTADLLKADITSNPRVPTKVDRAVSDTDWKSADAITSLYEHGYDENYLSKILSVGALGIGKNRKLVPTRWSITATDDIVGKDLLSQVRDLPASSEFVAYAGDYFGNYYLVLCFPGVWSFELFENYVPGWKSGMVRWSTDYEPFDGRKTYAEQCAGGYYTVKLAVLEHLRRINRQASVLAIRFVTEEYTTPLGVWVTREATRKALRSRPLKFADGKLLLDYARAFVRRKFGLVLEPILENSCLLRSRSQTSLNRFA